MKNTSTFFFLFLLFNFCWVEPEEGPRKSYLLRSETKKEEEKIKNVKISPSRESSLRIYVFLCALISNTVENAFQLGVK
jgi:hypothetical protein